MARYLDADHGRGVGVVGRSNPYRFGCAQTKYGRGRAALNRINSYLKGMIGRIADAKVRRMRRELALRSIHFNSVNENWVTESQRPRSGGV